MTERARHSTYTTESSEYRRAIHTPERILRTLERQVEVDMNRTIGQKLLELKERSGLSLAEIARLAGYKAASSIQKMFHADYAPSALPSAPALKLVTALVGRGAPAISPKDVLALTSSEGDAGPALKALTEFASEWAKTIQVFQTQPATVDMLEAEPIEDACFYFLNDDVSEFSAPEFLQRRMVWGFYVSTANMHPRYEVGEPALAQMRPPPRPGDDVVVTLQPETGAEAEGKKMIICRLVSNDGQQAMFEQFNPPSQFVIPAHRVASASRLLSVVDFLRDHTL